MGAGCAKAMPAQLGLGLALGVSCLDWLKQCLVAAGVGRRLLRESVPFAGFDAVGGSSRYLPKGRHEIKPRVRLQIRVGP